MIINATERKNAQNEILSYIPARLRDFLMPCVSEKTEEIRLRSNRPLSIRQNSQNFFISNSSRLAKAPINSVIVTKDDLEAATGLLCNHSVYAYEDEIKDGYITLPGGHRAGLCGNAVTNEEKITFISNISGLNYRIAREIKGCADTVIRDVLYNNFIRNTLLISPPGSGKTTLLRDLARVVSNLGKRVCILDERGEIAAMRNGVPGFDIGALSDVLGGCGKPVGIPMMLRSLSPDVIITDELFSAGDINAIREAKSRGVSVIATVHGKDVTDVDENILKNFNCIIVLSSRLGVGTVEKVMIR